MSKITLNNVGSLIDTTTAAITLNNNSTVIQTAFDNTLSRDGTTPNAMAASLDMDGHQIINLPNPATDLSPLRLKDLTDFNGGGTVSTLPAGGSAGQPLAKDTATDYDFDWAPITGTGSFVKSTSAALTTPTITSASLISPALTGANLGTILAGDISNATGVAAGLTAGHVTTNANLTGDVTSVGNATTIANNVVTNAKAAQMAANTIKGNNVGSTNNAADLTVPQVLALLGTGVLSVKITGVNFNSANTDNAISIVLPTGITRWCVNNIQITNASASISTATCGCFTSTGGGGQTIAANQAITVTSASANTNNNAQALTLTNAGTEYYNVTTVQFRIGTPQGSAATADVTIHYRVF